MEPHSFFFTFSRVFFWWANGQYTKYTFFRDHSLGETGFAPWVSLGIILLGAVFRSSQSVGFWGHRPSMAPGLKVSTTSFHVSEGTKPDLSMEAVDLQIVPWPQDPKAFEYVLNCFDVEFLWWFCFFYSKKLDILVLHSWHFRWRMPCRRACHLNKTDTLIHFGVARLLVIVHLILFSNHHVIMHCQAYSSCKFRARPT